MNAETPWQQGYHGVIHAIAALFHPHVEVVLHDIATDRVLLIANPFSGRSRGDSSLLSDMEYAAGTTIGPYEKRAPDGRRITSVSVVVADTAGTPRGLLCVNWDRSPTDDVLKALLVLTGPPVEKPPAALFERDWRERIAQVVHHWCREHQVNRSSMTRSDRLSIVRALDEADLFATRHAASHVASTLGIGRATVYALLRETRSSF
jgi:predicted transcriptional regulator YheO